MFILLHPLLYIIVTKSYLCWILFQFYQAHHSTQSCLQDLLGVYENQNMSEFNRCSVSVPKIDILNAHQDATLLCNQLFFSFRLIHCAFYQQFAELLLLILVALLLLILQYFVNLYLVSKWNLPFVQLELFFLVFMNLHFSFIRWTHHLIFFLAQFISFIVVDNDDLINLNFSIVLILANPMVSNRLTKLIDKQFLSKVFECEDLFHELFDQRYPFKFWNAYLP